MKTKFFSHLTFLIFSLSALISLSGCEFIADKIIDCAITSGPELEDVTLKDAYFNNPYYATIQASIQNDPKDDSYRYTFTIDELPRGLTYSKSGIRDLVISGSPLIAGTFTFEVKVTVEDTSNGSYSNNNNNNNSYDDGDTLCFKTTYQTYTIKIR